jgi:predicted negative regulator of RcsB-dependent stress response
MEERLSAMVSKSNSARSSASRSYLFAFAFAVILLGGYQAWRFYSTPPQLQASPDAKKTLDALFTALTSRDKAKLATCMERIEVHFADGKLSQKAANELRNCHKLAGAGSWEQAAKRLYWIIFEQPQ